MASGRQVNPSDNRSLISLLSFFIILLVFTTVVIFIRSSQKEDELSDLGVRVRHIEQRVDSIQTKLNTLDSSSKYINELFLEF